MAPRYSQFVLVAAVTAVLVVVGLGPFRAEPRAQNPDTLAALLGGGQSTAGGQRAGAVAADQSAARGTRAAAGTQVD